jgi:hypothetical protein
MEQQCGSVDGAGWRGFTVVHDPDADLGDEVRGGRAE